jgi:cystathionine gamma-lyase
MGADLVVHSITKYIGGHSDVVMGCICLNDKELYDKLFFNIKCNNKKSILIYLCNLAIGSGASPFDCYLALRGSKTLAIRMEKAQSTAVKLANYLESHKKIEKVIYPGLKSHPQYELNKR